MDKNNYKVIEVDNTRIDLQHARKLLFRAKIRINVFKSMAYHKRLKINLSELDKTASDIDKALIELGVS